MIGINEITLDIRGALKEAFHRLRRAHVPSHTLAAELLLMHVTAKDRAWLYAHPEELLDRALANRYLDLVEQRAAGVPTQYLTGKQEFWGLEFEVSPAVLIPRPETEHVIEVALERIGQSRTFVSGGPSSRSITGGAGLAIADVGTGSGCIAVALAKELPEARFYATDISGPAIEIARRNAARHGVLDRIQFAQCNLLDGIDAIHKSTADSQTHTQSQHSASGALLGFDLIVTNPPYIGNIERETLPREVRDHEPETALFSGDQGTDIYAPLISSAAARLKPGGILVLELGHKSLPRVRPMLDDVVWSNVSVTNDLAGIPRVLAAQRL